MADITDLQNLDPDLLQKLITLADDLKKKTEALLRDPGNNQLKTAMEQAKSAFDSAATGVSDFVKRLIQTSPALTRFTALAGGAGKTIVGTLGTAFNSVTDILSKYGQVVAMVGTKTGRDLMNPITDTGSAIGVFSTRLKAINDAFKSIAVAQTAVREAFVLTGGSIKDSEQLASDYPQLLRRMSAATGLSTKELHGMTQTLQRLGPDALRVTKEMQGVNSILGVTMRPTAALATTMRAFGKTAEEAAKFAADAFLRFGQSIPQTIRQMGFVAGAAKAAGVDMKTASEQITDASGSLAIFGQKSAAAAGLWTTFATSLKDSGVPIQAVGEMVKSLTSSIASMSVQNRAFIGMMSGLTQGASALGGALKLELAMRGPQGMQKNLQALTQSLSRFGGGQVITLEQAANNPQLEMQFQLQRQMLGKLTRISSAEQQNRILETLSNVQKGGLSTVEGGKALKDAFDKGKSVQDRQLTVLEKIEQTLRVGLGGGADKAIQAIDRTLRPAFRNLTRVSTGGSPLRREIGTQTFSDMVRAFGGRLRQTPGAVSRALTPTMPRGSQLRVAQQLLRGIRGQTSAQRVARVAQPPTRPNIRATLRNQPAATSQRTIRATLPGVRRGAPAISPTSSRDILNKIINDQQRGTPDATQIPATTEGRETRKIALMDQMLSTIRTGFGATRTEVPPTATATITPTTPAAPEIPGATGPTATVGKEGTVTTILVKIDGDDSKLKDAIKDSVINTVNNNSLGIR